MEEEEGLGGGGGGFLHAAAVAISVCACVACAWMQRCVWILYLPNPDYYFFLLGKFTFIHVALCECEL